MTGTICAPHLQRLISGHFREYDPQVLETIFCLASVLQSPPVLNHENSMAVFQWKFSRQIQATTAFLPDDQGHRQPASSWMAGYIDAPAHARQDLRTVCEV